jgi:hypothetical protein
MDWSWSWRQKKFYNLHNPRGPQGPWVSHTTTLPDGTEVTWLFKSIHGAYAYARKKGPKAFRQCPNKGVKEEKGRNPDSFDRAEKTRDYRHNDKVPTRWPFGSHKWACKQQARQDRMHVKRQIHNAMRSGRYDEVDAFVPPRDRWMWS